MCVWEQQMLLETDNLNRIPMFEFLTKDKGFSLKEAAKEVRRLQPIYTTDLSGTDTSDDRPLPAELMRRIIEYRERNLSTVQAAEALKARMASESSFNALVRKEIRAGRL
jgi:hypothetical protein